MLKRVLVPVDGSGESKHVLPYVSYLAGKFNFTVSILGVGIGSKRRRVNRLLDEYVHETVRDLRAGNLHAEPVMLYGRAAEEILSYNKSNDFNLIMMVTHGRGGITRWWMGSVAEQVVSQSPGSILLIRSKNADLQEVPAEVNFVDILVPLDGSEIGETALPEVEELAIKTGATANLLHVIPAQGAIMTKNTDADKLAEAAIKAGEEYLSNIAERLEKRNIKTVSKIGHGDPANVIVDYAGENNVSLIAMSTHGRSGIARWVLGSVADKVLHESEKPMWLVRSSKMVIN
jgi:nucleotide-binding universal stress UspA family protein